MLYYVAELTTEGTQTVIEFPDCPGCVTFADKAEDIATVAQEALEVWLAEHLSGGEAPPRPALMGNRRNPTQSRSAGRAR